MKTRTRALAGIGWTLLAACALQWMCLAPAQAVAQKRYVTIGEIGDSAKVTLHPGDLLRVVLKANVTTGYGWQVAANNASLLVASAKRSLPAEGSKVGAGGRQQLEFTAREPGQDRLVLAYVRPWEKQLPPARKLSLDITVTTVVGGGGPPWAVTPAGVVIGEFVGKLPCADCSGIQQKLILYTPGPNDFVNAYYVQSMTYLGGRSGNIVNVSAGRWFMEKGTAADPNGAVYALSQESSDRMENYQLQGKTLVPLDSQLKVIHSPFDMSLHEIP